MGEKQVIQYPVSCDARSLSWQDHLPSVWGQQIEAGGFVCESERQNHSRPRGYAGA